jgi:hypothetical protein
VSYDALELALELRRRGLTDAEIKDRLFAFRYGAGPNTLFKSNKETHPMQSTTLKIVLTEVEAGRVRATIPTAIGGVYAEASDPQTAAGQAVKSYFVLNPIQPTSVTDPVKAYTGPVYHSTSKIQQILHKAVNMQSAVRIEYRDSTGHETTRVIHPSKFAANGNIIAFDDLRAAVRAFVPSGVLSAQELS